ncbi:MAG TPA: transporter substrate-binding domain-containing protein [Methylomirabilota bacterium]|nr:transporter substrate-binding domain-containing protein [Methylomirabilota bacterium]
MDSNNTNNDTDQTASSPSPAPSVGAGNPPPVSENPSSQPPSVNPLEMSPQLSKPDMFSNPAASHGIPQPTAPMSSEQTPTNIPLPTAPLAQSSSRKGAPMILIIILLVFSFFCGLLIAAWYFQTQLQKDTTPKQATQTPAISSKTIVIGTDATFPPMEYTNKEGGLVGYDIDLGYRIANELGAKVEFKNIRWDDLFKALNNKQVAMIISSVTITDERKKLYDFSDSYLNAGQVVITSKENTTITSVESLKGKKIAVQHGTTNEQEALKHTSPNLVIQYPDFVQATKALVDGKVDAILSDLPGAKGIVTTNPTLKIATDPFTNEYYGVVFRKGDPNIKKINDILTLLQTKGVLTDLKQKWLD